MTVRMVTELNQTNNVLQVAALPTASASHFEQVVAQRFHSPCWAKPREDQLEFVSRHVAVDFYRYLQQEQAPSVKRSSLGGLLSVKHGAITTQPWRRWYIRSNTLHATSSS